MSTSVWKYAQAFGRQGDLNSVFVFDDDAMKKLLSEGGCSIHLGEVLGKHSSVDAKISNNTMMLLSADPAIIAFVEKEGPFGFPLSWQLEEYLEELAEDEAEDDDDE